MRLSAAALNTLLLLPDSRVARGIFGRVLRSWRRLEAKFLPPCFQLPFSEVPAFCELPPFCEVSFSSELLHTCAINRWLLSSCNRTVGSRLEAKSNFSAASLRFSYPYRRNLLSVCRDLRSFGQKRSFRKGNLCIWDKIAYFVGRFQPAGFVSDL